MNERAPGGETRGFLATVDVLHRVMSPRCSDDPCVCAPQERERLADAANDVCNALGALTPGEGYCDKHDELGCKVCGQEWRERDAIQSAASDREALREKLADLQQTFNHDDDRDEIDTWALLIHLLDAHYPPDVFPGGDGSDPGPRIVGLIRALDEARGQIATRTCTRCGDGDLYPRRCSQCGQRWADRACGPTHALITEELGLGDLRRDLAQLREERGREPGTPDDLEFWQSRADAAAADAAKRAGR